MRFFFLLLEWTEEFFFVEMSSKNINKMVVQVVPPYTLQDMIKVRWRNKRAHILRIHLKSGKILMFWLVFGGYVVSFYLFL